MNYGLTTSPENFQQADVLVIGFLDDFMPANLPQDTKYNAQLAKLSKHLTKANHYRCIHTEEDQTIIIIHCGKSEDYTISALKKTLKTIFHLHELAHTNTVNILLPKIEGLSSAQMANQLVLQTDYHLYQFNQFKTKKESGSNFNEEMAICFYAPGCQDSDIEKAKALCEGIRLTRDLGNYPANVCTPSYLGETALHLAQQFSNLHCRVIGEDEMKDMGMNLFLSVSQGSAEEPKLIELKYENGGSQAPIVLIGKGVTFDSGGYSIKPRDALEEMKYDMCGAASVLGVIHAIAQAKLPVNVVGIIAATENLVNSTATKPGDVFTSMSGQTVEVVNTDAEGRLILADALTYAERFNPDFVIDLATLTGAMIISLGSVYTGIFSQDNELATAILKASEESQDLCWRMPVNQEYAEILSSPIADLANASWDRSAGAITAAWFLSNFTKKYRWAHCDIAGTAWQSGKQRVATGRPVAMLFQLIEDQVKE